LRARAEWGGGGEVERHIFSDRRWICGGDASGRRMMAEKEENSGSGQLGY